MLTSLWLIAMRADPRGDLRDGRHRPMDSLLCILRAEYVTRHRLQGLACSPVAVQNRT